MFNVLDIFDKLNVSHIIRAHINTLWDYEKDTLSKGDIFVFFGLPALAAALILYLFKTPVDRATSNILITSLSIFSALLLNLLMLIYDLVRKEEETEPDPGTENRAVKLLQEIFTNISYSIVVSVFCVAILLIAYLEIRSGIFLQIFSLVVYFLVIQFLLTLFMVLKRVHILLSLRILGAPIPSQRPAKTRRSILRLRSAARRPGGSSTAR
jgi:hypothetical protein